MKIDPSKLVSTRLDPAQRTKAGEAGGKSSASSARASFATDAGSPIGPAASVEINAAAIESLRGLDGTSDMALLDELRNKVASGNFEIKFDEVAQAILTNAISASKSRITSP